MPPQERGQQKNSRQDLEDPACTMQYSVDQTAPMDHVRRPSTIRRESFLHDFVASKGPPQIIVLIMLLALGFGSTIGVVPAVVTDRYARLQHGYTDERDCSDYGMGEKPQACLDGSADAQSAVAMEQMISNTLTFFTSSLIGSISDEHGRKGILALGVFLSSLSPLCLVLLQLRQDMSPFWYYAAGASTGLVNWIAVALSSLSDVMPAKWRAPSFGLLLAGFSLGFALAPQLALFLGHWWVSILALTNVCLGFLLIVFFFPETVPPETAAQATLVREEMVRGLDGCKRTLWYIYRPLWELTILNRSVLFRLLSLLAFFSGMVSAGDRTLLIYYIEERLSFNDKDIAVLFMIMGVLGIFVQGVALKVLNDLIGERHVVMISFILGCIHNLLYGIAENKATIFLGVCVSAFVGMSFPTISAIKANNVEESEQGRIQGALFSVQALASASGPMVLRWIYGLTKDGALFGPGSMFIFASAFYVMAVYCAYLLPKEANSKRTESSGTRDTEVNGLSVESPLLSEPRAESIS